MNTRAKDNGKRGLEDLAEASGIENKKKSSSGGVSSGPAALDVNIRSEEGRELASLTQFNPPDPALRPPPAGNEEDDNRPVNKSTLNNHVSLLMDKLNSIEGNTVSLNREVSSIFTKLDEQSGRIQGTANKVAEHDLSINELKKKNSDLTQQLSEMKRRQSTVLQEVNSSVDVQMKAFQATLRKDNELFRAEIINVTNKKVDCTAGSIREDFMEEQSQTRKNNLIIMGFREPGEGEDEFELLKSLFKDSLGITGVKINDLIRLGKSGGEGPRPALVKFKTWADRKRVWFAKSKLKNDQTRRIWFQEDMPKPMKEAQRTLYHSFKKAKSMPDTFKSVQLKGTKLILDGASYGEKDLGILPQPLRPQSLATRHSETVVIFFGRASPLSNHHQSPFLLEGQQFHTMEQFLAWRKAKLAKRKSLINRALSSVNPVICKGILNELRGVNADEWEDMLDEVVTSGLRAKFTQNRALAQFLISTHPKTLGEASLNRRWGIGLPLNSPEALDVSKWVEGGNLLGKKLSQVREELRAEK